MIILMNMYLVIGAIFGTMEMVGEYATGMGRGYLFRALFVTILWPMGIPSAISGFRMGIEENKEKNKDKDK